MYWIFKSFLFILPAETAHYVSTLSLNYLARIQIVRSLLKSMMAPSILNSPIVVSGLYFKNRVGLAAGFDKNGDYIQGMSVLGFGFIEVGTVTPRPQKGNPKPRLFRLQKDRALINRMGFNNKGVDYLVKKLKETDISDIIIGGNIGKNKDTPNEEAYKDYLFCFEKLYPWVDYFVVNISSPNTPGLRSLQQKEPLKRIVITLMEARTKYESNKPIYLKISPDLTNAQLDDIIDLAIELSLDGIIATNTTVKREGLQTSPSQLRSIGTGGLSGKPLNERSLEVISRIHKKTQGKVPIIGVGGISTPLDAREKIDAGASLIQIYSGLIYNGPGFVKHINRFLSKKTK